MPVHQLFSGGDIVVVWFVLSMLQYICLIVVWTVSTYIYVHKP